MVEEMCVLRLLTSSGLPSFLPSLWCSLSCSGPAQGGHPRFRASATQKTPTWCSCRTLFRFVSTDGGRRLSAFGVIAEYGVLRYGIETADARYVVRRSPRPCCVAQAFRERGFVPMCSSRSLESLRATTLGLFRRVGCRLSYNDRADRADWLASLFVLGPVLPILYAIGGIGVGGGGGGVVGAGVGGRVSRTYTLKSSYASVARPLDLLNFSWFLPVMLLSVSACSDYSQPPPTFLAQRCPESIPLRLPSRCRWCPVAVSTAAWPLTNPSLEAFLVTAGFAPVRGDRCSDVPISQRSQTG